MQVKIGEHTGVEHEENSGVLFRFGFFRGEPTPLVGPDPLRARVVCAYLAVSSLRTVRPCWRIDNVMAYSVVQYMCVSIISLLIYYVLRVLFMSRAEKSLLHFAFSRPCPPRQKTLHFIAPGRCNSPGHVWS